MDFLIKLKNNKETQNRGLNKENNIIKKISACLTFFFAFMILITCMFIFQKPSNIADASIPENVQVRENEENASFEEGNENSDSGVMTTADGVTLVPELNFSMFYANGTDSFTDYKIEKEGNNYNVSFTFAGERLKFKSLQYDKTCYTLARDSTHFGLASSSDSPTNGFYIMNCPLDAGNYPAGLTFTLKTGYAWSDGSTDPIVINFTIDKAVIDIPTLVDHDEDNEYQKTVKYSMINAHEFNLSNASTDLQKLFKVSRTSSHLEDDGWEDNFIKSHAVKGKAVGTYYVKLTPLNTNVNNFNWSDGTNEVKTFTLKIDYFTVEAPEVAGGFNSSGDGTSASPYNAEFYFDGNKKSLVFTAKDGYIFRNDNTEPKSEYEIIYTSSQSSDSTPIIYWSFNLSTDKKTLTATYLYPSLTNDSNNMYLNTANSNCRWENGATRYYYDIKILSPKVVKPILEDCDGGTGTEEDPFYKTFEYDGERHSITIKGYDPLYMSLYDNVDYWTTKVTGDTVVATKVSEVVASVTTAKFYISTTSSTWEDGTSGRVYYNVLITKKIVSIPNVVEGIDGGTGTEADRFYKQFDFDGNQKSINFVAPEGYVFDAVGTKINHIIFNSDSTHWTFKLSADKKTLTATLISPSINAGTSYGVYLTLFSTFNNIGWENDTHQLYYQIKIVKPKVEKPVLEGFDGGTGTQADPYYKNYEYDGQNHSLTISGVNPAIMIISASSTRWEQSISDNILTLTRLESNVATAGSYSAYINVNSGASWSDGSTGAIYFKLNITRKAITDPVVENGIARGTGTSEDPFVIEKQFDDTSLVLKFTNLDKDFISCSISSSSTSYPQTYDDVNKIFTVTRVSTDVGSYTFNLGLVNGNYCFENGSTENKYYTLSIIKRVIDAPSMAEHDEGDVTTKTLVYNEQTRQFIFNNILNDWTKYNISSSTSYGDMALVSWADNILELSGSKVSVYTITVSLKELTNSVWADTNNNQDKIFKIIINKKEIKVPEIVGNAGSNSLVFEYSGNPHQVQVSGILENYFSVSLQDGIDNKGISEGILTFEVTNANTYIVSFIISDFNNFKWEGYETDSLTYTVSVGAASIAKPNLQGDSSGTETSFTTDFCSSDINLVIEGVSDAMTYTLPEGVTLISHENNVLTVKAFNAGTYEIKIGLKDSNFTWLDGGNGEVSFTLKINRINIKVPYLDDGSYSGATVNIYYTGEWIELRINAKSDGSLVWKNDYDNLLEEVSWTDDVLILRAKNSASYRVTINHANTSNTRWDLTSGSAPTVSTAGAYFKLVIDKKLVAKPVYADDSATGTVSYNKDYYYVKINNVPEGIFEYSFPGSEMELESWQDGVLIFKVKEVASYSVRFTLVDSKNYKVSGSTTSTPAYTFKLTIKKASHIIPTYSGDRNLTYNGEFQEFVIVNIFKEWDQYNAPAGVEEVSWTDEGVLTLRMKNVGAYAIYLSIIDPSNCRWFVNGSTYSYTEKTLTFNIKVKTITASVKYYSTDSALQSAFDSLGSGEYPQWPAGSAVWAVVTLNGLHPDDHPELDLYYYASGNSSQRYPLEEDTSMGVYYFKMPEKYVPGTHYTIVNLASGADVANYKLSQTSSRFIINTAISDFEDSDLIWQYKNDNKVVVIDQAMGTKDNPLQLDFNGKAYSFSITKNASELQTLGVKISSYSGNTAATEAKDGVYCAKVTIVAYSTKYFYKTKTFEVYYTIGKVKIDLSGIRWNYLNPLTYSGKELNVYIDGSTLPAGLSIKSYSGDINMINATEGTGLKYSTTVEFTVSSKSYYLPDMNNPDSYNGTFSWTIEWEVNKAIIYVVWKQGKLVTDDGVFEVPVLTTGNGFVNYSFEQQGDDGEFFAIEELIKVPGKAVNYRVMATLKDGTGSEDEINYAQNYKLVVNDSENNPNPIGFTIGKDQYPVQVGIEINGQIVDIDGNGVSTNSFPYTGNQYVAKPVVFGGDLSISNFTVTYYSESSVKGSTIPPTDVGKYRVVVTITYKSNGSYDSDDYYIEGNNEFEFEITKASFDTSNLKWQYSHEGVVIATFDSIQGKWLDEMGREVAPIAYDGKPYTLTLLGMNNIAGLSIRLSGNIGTDVGSYVTHADFTYNSQNYNKPEIPDFNWEIGKGNIDVSAVHWSYEEAFIYEYFAGNAVVYKVELVGLPDYLKGKITYLTNGVNGNSASSIGEYVTSFILGEIDTTRYNDVVWPDNLIPEITWEILQKRLFNPEYQFESGDDDTEEKVAWEFDAQIHDLLALFNNIDSSLADYYNISIEYAYDNMSFIPYGGYNGNKFSAIYAGTYRVTFAIKDGINAGTTNVVWGNGKSSNQYFRVFVSKATIVITGWNEAAEDSTIIIDKGSLFENIFKYNYLDEAEKIVPIDFIYNSIGGETFYITPVLKNEFANSVDFEFATGVSQKLMFVTEEYDETEEPPTWLEKPNPETIIIEFDSTEHTLQISDWINNWDEIKEYLEIVVSESDNLTQFAVGEYAVVLRFKKGAYVSWVTDNESIIDKSTLTLKFKITTKVIEIPEIPETSYTGETIDVSENFGDEFNFFVTSISGNIGTNAGEYTLVLSLKYPENSTWSDGSTEDKYITWIIKTAVLEIPTINNSLTFDGSEHYVTEILNGFDADIMSLAPLGSHGIDAGAYVAKVTLTNSNYVWAGDIEEVVINWEILKVIVSKPSIDSEINIIYDGEAHNVSSILSGYDANLMIIIAGDDRGTDAKTYSLTISLPSENYIWNDNSTENIVLEWEIKQRVINVSYILDSTFDNLSHDILEALGLSTDDLFYISIKAIFNGTDLNKLEWFNAGNYAVVIKIDESFNEDSNNVVFADNSTGEKNIEFVINRLEVIVNGWTNNGQNSTVKFEDTVLPDNMADYIFVDTTGNEVSTEQIETAEPGTEFYIRYVLKSEFENNVNITYSDEEYKQHKFVAGDEIIPDDATEIKIPVINDVVYSGNEINIWEIISYKFNGKIMLVSGNLGTVVGEYTLTIALTDKEGTTWEDGTTEDKQVLWKITTKEVEKPMLDENEFEFSGDIIDVLDKLQNYNPKFITISGDNQGTNCAEYEISISLDSNCVWKGETNSDTYIISWKINPKSLTIPTYVGGFEIFDNEEHDLLELCGANDLINYLNVSVIFNGDDFASNLDGKFMATDSGTYIVTFEIKSELNPETYVNVCWSDGTTLTKTIEINVEKLEYLVSGWNENNENSIVVSDSSSINQDFLNYVIYNAEGSVVSIQDVIDAQGMGKKFKIQVSIKDEFADNVILNFAENVLDYYEFTTTLDPEKAVKPSISSDEIVYDKNEHSINDIIIDFDETKMEFAEGSELSGTNAKTYTVTISLKDGYTWADGSTDDLVLTWTILKAQINGSWNEEGEYPVFECENIEDKNKINILYLDQEGNVVTEFKAGENYIAKVELKDSENYELVGETEKEFLTEEDIVLPSEDKLFEVVESNNTFIFVDGNGNTINFLDHTYDPTNPHYLKNIALNDSLQDIANQFVNLNIRFFTKDDVEIFGDQVIATGMKLRIYKDDTIIDEIILVLKGDINGDGKINMLDKAVLNAFTSGSLDLEDAFRLASDTNDDGKINMLDKAGLNAFTAGNVDFFEGLSVKEKSKENNFDDESYFENKFNDLPSNLNHKTGSAGLMTKNINQTNALSVFASIWQWLLVSVITILATFLVLIIVKKYKRTKNI